MLEGLKTEIIESEKARTDLLKWKLIVSSALASVGFGLLNKDDASISELPHLAICAIPFACLYVDLLCYNLQVRMLVISLFMQNYRPKDGSSEAESYCMYEKFCGSVRGAFKLEDLALEQSTRFISLLIMLSSIPIALTHAAGPLRVVGIALLLLAGGFGIVLSMVIKKKFNKKIHKAEKMIHQDMKQACQSCEAVISFYDLVPE